MRRSACPDSQQAEWAVTDTSEQQVLKAAAHLRQHLGSPPEGEKRSTEREETMGHHAQGGVVVEAPTGAAFKMVQPHFLLQLLVVALHPPAQLRQPHQLLEGSAGQQRREVILHRPLLLSRPLHQQPFLLARRTPVEVPLGRAHTHRREARGLLAAAALAPTNRVELERVSK